MMKASAFALFLTFANPIGVEAFSTSSKVGASPSTGIFNARQGGTASRLQAIPDPLDIASVATTGSIVVADKDWGEFTKSFLIVATLGGGLIPATIAANAQMFRTLSGKKDSEADEDPSKIREGDTSFDPTIKETKYRSYVEDSGATGPELPFSSVLFAADKIPLADVVAILGRIDGVDSLADWKNLPSTKLPGVSQTNPPQWLPRKAFKVNIRKAPFRGWPIDPKTGLPIGGEELKASEEARIKKKDAAIGDAALDAVFDTWAWGASIATPDKVEKTLSIYQKGSSVVDLGAFVGSAVRGRSATFFAAATFIVIQLVTFIPLFIAPTLKILFDIDINIF